MRTVVQLLGAAILLLLGGTVRDPFLEEEIFHEQTRH